MMITRDEWQYDEFQHVGTDFNSVDEIALYMERMSRVRDYEAEATTILNQLGLPAAGGTLIEYGMGPGEFAVRAAARGHQVNGVDISQAMLDYARQNAERHGSSACLELHRAGFLTYEHQGSAADAIVTQVALHHLPDFWKAVALRRIFRQLRPGGRFFLRDVVFRFDVERLEDIVPAWVGALRTHANDDYARRIMSHIRDEHSTQDWIMEGLLRAAGFTLLRVEAQPLYLCSYLCEKPAA